jgi:hypothetical protein
MTIRFKSRLLAVSCRASLAVLLATPVWLSGCASSSGDVEMAAAPGRGAMNTGTYPNLNVPPQVAAAPLNEADKASLSGRIASAQSRQSASGRGAGTTGDPVWVKTLAENHGKDTLEAIEAQ